jgi:hypothetical protein
VIGFSPIGEPGALMTGPWSWGAACWGALVAGALVVGAAFVAGALAVGAAFEAPVGGAVGAAAPEVGCPGFVVSEPQPASSATRIKAARIDEWRSICLLMNLRFTIAWCVWMSIGRRMNGAILTLAPVLELVED